MWLAALYCFGLFAAGLVAWTLLEYAIHGWMGHRFATFVTPIHAVHHRDPHAVFAIGAWLPAVAPLIVGILFHAGTFSLVYGGSLAGFAIYEAIHYRIHFCRPICDLETRLRTRHLAHHYRTPTRCYGVTTPLWDLVFGTGVTDGDTAWMRTNASRIAPLDGSSNIAAPGLVFRRLIHGHRATDGPRGNCTSIE